jgi:hypothetical protein
MSSFVIICPARADFFRADGQTNGQTNRKEMKKLIFALRNFAKAPKKEYFKLVTRCKYGNTCILSSDGHVHNLVKKKKHGNKRERSNRRNFCIVGYRGYQKSILTTVCLFSWRYNPLWLYFHSRVAAFSLLVFEVS